MEELMIQYKQSSRIIVCHSNVTEEDYYIFDDIRIKKYFGGNFWKMMDFDIVDYQLTPEDWNKMKKCYDYFILPHYNTMEKEMCYKERGYEFSF